MPSGLNVTFGMGIEVVSYLDQAHGVLTVQLLEPCRYYFWTERAGLTALAKPALLSPAARSSRNLHVSSQRSLDYIQNPLTFEPTTSPLELFEDGRDEYTNREQLSAGEPMSVPYT